MRFDLSDEQQALSAVADRALRYANGIPERQCAALHALGLAGDTLREARSPLLLLALVSEAAGHHLAPLLPLHTSLALLLLADAADDTLKSALSADGTSVLLALGDADRRLIEGDEDSWILWQQGASLALFKPGTSLLEPGNRADRSRDLRIASTPSGTPVLIVECAAAARSAMLVLQAADSFGAASAAFQMTLDYARTRVQFGRPLASFQAYQHQMADLAVALDPCRFLWWRAAYAWGDAGARERLALLANAHVCDVAVSVTRAAVEAHGAIGFTAEYSLQSFVKRVRENWSAIATPAALHASYADIAGWSSPAA